MFTILQDLMSVKGILITLLFIYYVNCTQAKKKSKSKRKKGSKKGKGNGEDETDVYDREQCDDFELDLEGCLSMSKLLICNKN